MTTRTRRVTERQAQMVLRAVARRFKAWIDPTSPEGAPKLIMDFDWLGTGPTPHVVWEGGPYQWATLDPTGDIEEEFGTRVGPLRPLPKNVYTEPMTGWALGIYRSDV